MKCKKNLIFSNSKLDVYYPDNPTHNNVVLCIHGGGWAISSKSSMRDVASFLSSHGYVCVCPSYRLSSFLYQFTDLVFINIASTLVLVAFIVGGKAEMMLTMLLLIISLVASISMFTVREANKNEDQIEDLRSAALWIKENIASDFGGDPNSFHLLGFSAGAQLAAQLATNPAYLADVLEVKSLVGISGPYSDKRMAETAFGSQILKNTFGENTQIAFPIYHCRGKLNPRTLLVNAEQDWGLRRAALDYSVALAESGADVQSFVVKGTNHLNIVNHWGEKQKHNKSVAMPVLDFLNSSGN